MMWSRRPLLGAAAALLSGPSSEAAGGMREPEDDRNARVGRPMVDPAVAGAQGRFLPLKLDDQPVSVTDFMTPEQIADTRNPRPTLDVTEPFMAAFEAARISARTVFIPDGRYLVGNLLFGTQNVKGQSSAPLGLIGQSRAGAVLVARPGLTGTLLQSWSVAGVHFSDFHIVTEGTAAQAWDCAWKSGAGPSTQNVIYNIMVTGGTAPVHVNWDDLNDTFPFNVTVRVNDRSSRAKTCGISAMQSGGYAILRGIATANCYLRFGAQNGELDGCWGSGVELAGGCLNYLKIDSCYFYANEWHKAVIWSESFAGSQSARALTFIACQFITLDTNVMSYFNVNLYSAMRVIGCQFIGPAPQLLGPQARRDPFGLTPAILRLEGGTAQNALTLTDRGGVEIVAEDFINDQTGRAFTKDRSGSFTPRIAGSIVAGGYEAGAGTSGRYVRNGNMVSFKCRVQWRSHQGKGNAVITGLPFQAGPGGVSSVVLEHGDAVPDNVRATMSNNEIVLVAGPRPFNLPSTGDLVVSGFYWAEA